MIGGVPWRPWDHPMFRFGVAMPDRIDSPGHTVSDRTPLHPGVLKYRHDLFMAERRQRQWVGREELNAWFDEEMRKRGQL